MIKTDLHFHSYYSDGIYSPKELVTRLKKRKMQKVALTDHNTVDGVKEFLILAKEEGLKAITGVEIYTNYQGKSLHLLGYGFNLEDKKLNIALKGLQAQRIPRIKKAIKILQADGWELDEKEVFNTVSSYPGLVHLAGPLQKNPQNWERIKKDFNWFEGKIIPITEIIARYFVKSDGHLICPETILPFVQAIDLIKQAGGWTVLAHPGQQLSWRDDDLIVKLKEIGLDGLEAISSHHSWSGMEHWQKIARENDLEITIGSDFHGEVPQEWGFKVRSQWEY